MLALMLLAASPAWAVPNLQIYIPGAEYDESIESWKTYESNFELWVVGARHEITGVKFAMAVPEGEQGSIGLTWSDPVQSDYGNPSVTQLTLDAYNGMDYLDYRDSYKDGNTPDPMTYGYGESQTPQKGDGSNLPRGGIFPTNFYEYYIGDLGTEYEVENYIPGDEGTAQGEIKKFMVDVTGYTWIDMVAYNYVVVGNPGARHVFSPYSHAGAANVPEPTTILLFGTGLLVLAWMGKRKLQQKHLETA